MSFNYSTSLLFNNNDKYNTNKSSKDSLSLEFPIFDNYFDKKSYTFDFGFPFFQQTLTSQDSLKVDIPSISGTSNPFEEKTKSLMYKTYHKTNLLNIAQNHLGYQEVTEDEYSNLSYAEKDKTQMHFIGNYGDINHEWCAHAASHLSEEANMDIDGHKIAVQQFIDWAENKGYYRPIKTNKATVKNYLNERKLREVQISSQFKEMKEGDYIVWKSSYVAELPNGKLKEKNSSHIGILESVNKDGTITVIEGNANEFLTGEDFERELVKNSKDGIVGAQEIGDFKEVNRRDGLIRKTYTAENLASFGYAGYIDTQEIVK